MKKYRLYVHADTLRIDLRFDFVSLSQLFGLIYVTNIMVETKMR